MTRSLTHWTRLAVLVLALAAASIASASARPYVLTLPQGTQLSLRATVDVNANKVHAGDPVSLTVTRGVRYKNVNFIRDGAAARGTVVYARGSGVGFRGALMVAVLDVQAKNGTWIPIRTQAQGGSGLARVIADDVYDWSPPVFPSGKNQRLNYQRNFHVWTDEARTFTVTPQGSHTTISLAGPPAPPAGKRLVKVTDGLVVRLQPAREISSGRVATGDRLDFVATAPVVVNGATVVAQNAPARGTVLLSRPAEMANKGGILVISLDKVRAVDGTWIPLASSDASRGRGNKVLGAAASVLIVPGIGLAIEGRESVIHQDKELDTYVFGNRFVAVPR